MNTPTYTAGQAVQIEPRTFPGSNKQGGTALITHIHHDANNNPITIDVHYVLGGHESGIELTYVSLPTEPPRRGTSERKQDVKMNINKDSKGKKKRGALKKIDRNSKKQKVEKGSFDELPSGCVLEGDWMVIKSGKLSDYTPYFTKGTPVQFWWDNEQGWLHATCLNDITRNLSRGIIRWIVKMKFKEDDEIFSYAFLPKDNRWKIKIENNESEEAKSKLPKKQKAVAKKSKDDKSSNKEEKAPFTIATDSDIEDDVVLSQLKPSSKSKSTPKLKAPTKQKGAVKKSKDDKSTEKAPFTIATDSDMEDDVVLSQLKPSSKSKSTPKLKASTKQEGVGKEAKDDQSSNKKEKCAFTIATDSDMEDDVVLSQLKPSSKSKSTQNTKRDASKKEKALPSVTPVAKNDATKKTFLKTVDLCYGGAKNAKSTAATGGDAIFVTKPKLASISFQYNSVGSYSAAAAANSAATSKLMGQKKNETIPACKFHKSTAKMSNPFQTTHHPSAAAKSYPFSARAEDTIKIATSKAIKSSRDAAYAATKPAKPKTIGCLTVMDGLNRPTQFVKPRATIPKEKTMTEKIYNKAHEEAKSFMAGMMDKNPYEEKAERPFSTSSDEEEELDVKIGQDRKSMFQDGLAETFFKSYHDVMDVDVFIKRLNDHTAFRGYETFTLPEVTKYIDQFHEEQKIYVNWKDGNCGKIYKM